MTTEDEVIHRFQNLVRDLKHADAALDKLHRLVQGPCPKEVSLAYWEDLREIVNEFKNGCTHLKGVYPEVPHPNGAFEGTVVGYDPHTASGTIWLDDRTALSFSLTAYLGRGKPCRGTRVRAIFNDNPQPGSLLAVHAI